MNSFTLAPSLSPDESELVGCYRSTDARGKAAIMAVAQSQAGDSVVEADEGLRKGA